MDAILAIRLLLELHKEFDRSLPTAFIDIKSALDSVDREALWRILSSIRILDAFISLIRDLHTESGARVRIGRSLTDK